MKPLLFVLTERRLPEQEKKTVPAVQKAVAAWLRAQLSNPRE